MGPFLSARVSRINREGLVEQVESVGSSRSIRVGLVGSAGLGWSSRIGSVEFAGPVGLNRSGLSCRGGQVG